MKKHSIRIMGHATSFSLEPAFWDELNRIAKCTEKTLNGLIQEIDCHRTENLSSAIRVFILNTLKQEIPSNKDAE